MGVYGSLGEIEGQELSATEAAEQWASTRLPKPSTSFWSSCSRPRNWLHSASCRSGSVTCAITESATWPIEKSAGLLPVSAAVTCWAKPGALGLVSLYESTTA